MTQARQEQRLNSFLTAENLSTVDEDRFANPPPLASIFKRNDTRHVVVHARTGRIPPYGIDLRRSPFCAYQPSIWSSIVKD
jgi:hypothetical protein